MEATVVSVGQAVLDGALGYAKSKAAEEVALQLGVERDVAFIADELEMMQSFLMTADEERDQQHKVLTTTWVKQVRELAYNVEDSLMDFALHSEKKPSWWCNPRTLWQRRNIAKEVKELRAKVEDVSSRNLRYRLIKDGSGSKPNAAAELASIASAAMFGINEARLAALEQENAKVDLRQLITDEEEELRVIAVWGSNGDPGKIYAIREVYDDPKVNTCFGCRAWIRLMCPFNPKEFLQVLVKQFFENPLEGTRMAQDGKTVGCNVLMEMEKMGLSDLVHAFDEKVSGQRYLVVINDLPTIEEWDCIKRYFPDNKKRSRIIICTQQVEIASLCTEQPHQVSEFKQLSSDQTLYLFHKKVMLSSDSAEPISNSNTDTTGKKSAMSDSEIKEEDEEQPKGGTAEKRFDRSRTMALVDEVLTGRATEKSKVIELIGQVGDEQGCKVISVWGMGGIGKTTLIRNVYQSEKLGGWKRAWATALRPFNPEVLIRSLALQLQKYVEKNSTGQSGTKMINIATMKLQDLIKELTKLLTTQKCLIVLDDISSTAEWDLVKNCLENAGRIIVTTREKDIAKHCSREDKNMYSLSSLKDDMALDLFKGKVFKDSNKKIDLRPDMKEQAILILKKCDGLPLAISTIGRFLATKPKTAIEWRKMNDHISAELETNPELRKINTVLMRSYDGLPYHLKSSFLYMSIFPEDHTIRRKRLVRRWIAEGYSREKHGMLADDVGANYFDELFNRSMILPGEGVNHYSGRIDSYQLHDIIRDICISKAREESFVFTLEEGCCLSRTGGVIRHLVISSSWNRDKNVFECMLDLSHVRSLTVFGEWRSFFISDKMRFLRVLDLEDTTGLRDHHLYQIGDFLHLKYLSLRGCRNMYHLPNSLGKLRHLQTLDIRATSIFELPITITKLRNLQCLRANVSSELSKDDVHLFYNRVLDMIDIGESLFSPLCCCALFSRCAERLRPNQQDQQGDGPKEASEDGDSSTEASEDGDSPTATIRKKHCCAPFLRCTERLRPNQQDQQGDGPNQQDQQGDGPNQQDQQGDGPKEACEDGDPPTTTITKRHGVAGWGRSLLFHSRTILWRACTLLSMCHLFWRPQLVEDGLNMHDIFNLYRLYTIYKEDRDRLYGVKVPRGIAKLKALHTLGVVNVALGNGKGEATLKELRELTKLRKLKVDGINKKNSEKFWSAIARHNQLQSLSVTVYTRGDELDGCLVKDLTVCTRGDELDGCLVKDLSPPKCLESLSPPKCLESFKLQGKLVKLTEWIPQLQNLSKLQLVDSELNQSAAIQEVGMLPNLAVLRLRWNSFMAKQLHFQGSTFLSLMVLQLYGLHELRSVEFEEHAMPKLELLESNFMPKVEKISGLKFLTSLKEIQLGDYISDAFKEEVRSQLEKNHQNRVKLKLGRPCYIYYEEPSSCTIM